MVYVAEKYMNKSRRVEMVDKSTPNWTLYRKDTLINQKHAHYDSLEKAIKD